MGSNVPQARELLKEALGCDMSEEAREIVSEALGMMTRTYIKPKTRVESRKVTRQMAEQVLRYYNNHPDQSCRAIGEVFTINQGRVSEIIAGGYEGLRDYP
jgi:hypothetical protein